MSEKYVIYNIHNPHWAAVSRISNTLECILMADDWYPSREAAEKEKFPGDVILTKEEALLVEQMNGL